MRFTRSTQMCSISSSLDENLGLNENGWRSTYYLNVNIRGEDGENTKSFSM